MITHAPLLREARAALAELPEARWNRFDIVEAWYLFSILWHGGQFTPEYAITGRIKRMGGDVRILPALESLDENTQAIYWGLVIADMTGDPKPRAV